MMRYHEIIRRNSEALRPRPTGVAPRLKRLSKVRAVLFDIYGTMLISASGDVGTSCGEGRAVAAADACAAAGLSLSRDTTVLVSILSETILAHHRHAQDQGIAFPEVDIVAVWNEVLDRLAAQGAAAIEAREVDIRRLAIEYETRVNPVWPMPDLRPCLESLLTKNRQLGLVSNAQFFTLELFPALLERNLEELGFSRSLQFFSFQHRQAKPGTYLYELARQSLESMGIRPDEALYIGNDMLNDIMPAKQVGFRTALFAGDARSLRMRESDDRTQGLQPDLVLTALSQLADCVV
jgi:putative hydrolase of the HAD superfamily